MNTSTYLIYLSAILVLTATPGPSILLCVTKSIKHGFNASMFTALGSLAAIMLIMTLSFTGLGVLVASSEFAFNIVKWLGAAYLIYLGIKTFFSTTTNFETPDSTTPSNNVSRASLMGSGFLVGATNPKAIVFFTALFPQFIDVTRPLMSQYVILVCSFAVMELSWLALYAYFGAKSSSWIQQKGRARFFNRLTGGLFISAGALLGGTRLQS